MINQEFDDDIPDEDEFLVDQDVTNHLVKVYEDKPEEPKGDFSRTLSGRVIWFNSPIPGQFHAWRRHRESLSRRFDKIKVKAKAEPSLEVLRELSQLSEQFDLDTLELVESLMTSEDDKDFVAREMISGRVTMQEIHRVLFGDPEPDDDQPEPVKPAKKTIPKKVTAAKKKTANAKRIQK